MTIQDRLAELGEMREQLEDMLEKMWEKRSTNCRSKRKTDLLYGLPYCAEIKNLDHPTWITKCSYNTCPYT